MVSFLDGSTSGHQLPFSPILTPLKTHWCLIIFEQCSHFQTVELPSVGNSAPFLSREAERGCKHGHIRAVLPWVHCAPRNKSRAWSGSQRSSAEVLGSGLVVLQFSASSGKCGRGTGEGLMLFSFLFLRCITVTCLDFLLP